MTHASVPTDELLALGITDNFVRLSVGLENPRDLIDDLEQAMLKAVNVFNVFAIVVLYVSHPAEDKKEINQLHFRDFSTQLTLTYIKYRTLKSIVYSFLLYLGLLSIEILNFELFLSVGPTAGKFECIGFILSEIICGSVKENGDLESKLGFIQYWCRF